MLILIATAILVGLKGYKSVTAQAAAVAAVNSDPAVTVVDNSVRPTGAVQAGASPGGFNVNPNDDDTNSDAQVENYSRMSIHKISRRGNFTGNKSRLMTQVGYPSTPTRTQSLDEFIPDQGALFGNNDTIDFDPNPKTDGLEPLPNIEQPYDHFNSQMDMTCELPSTTNVGRWTHQNNQDFGEKFVQNFRSQNPNQNDGE